MGSGSKWSKGVPERYLFVEWLFNNADPADLAKFVKKCVKPTTHGNDVLALQASILGDGPALAAAGALNAEPPAFRQQAAAYNWRAVADAWYGDDLIWPADNPTKPGEIERLMRAARCWIAERRIEQPGRTCEWYTQCYHQNFECRITWPRGSLGPNAAMMIWVFVPENQSIADADARNAAQLRADRAAQILAVDSARAQAVATANDEAQGLPARDAAELVLEQELKKMEDIVRRTVTDIRLGYPVFQGTTEAMVNIPGVDLAGGVEIRSLEDIFDDPREHRLNQPPSEADDPQGARVSGVSIRWNRAATPSRGQLF